MEFAEPSGDEAGRRTVVRRRHLQKRLLAWFASARRDLPWRRDRDPYRIWVSEVMLQQTTVAAVVPAFERFLSAFPDLLSLAYAEEQDVLRLWEGLGYYRRARDLHRAARLLVATHAGAIPDDPDYLRTLPGLGRYTLGAILSQAFDHRLPILEANSLRVLCRLFGRTDDPRRGPAQRWLWQVAEELLPEEHVGDYNQAIMELGALVCTPTSPRCQECPWASPCVARRLGLQESIPLRSPPPAVTEVQEAAVVVRRGNEVLLVQRPDSGRWARMWEFPHGPLRDGESHEEAAQRLVEELTSLRVSLRPQRQTLRHTVTRFRITLVCFDGDLSGGTFASSFYRAGQWVKPDQLADYPVSSPQRRLARAIQSPSRSTGPLS